MKAAILAAALLGLYAAADADPAVRAILVAVVAIVGVVAMLVVVDRWLR